jgi:hypothetical protein
MFGDKADFLREALREVVGVDLAVTTRSGGAAARADRPAGAAAPSTPAARPASGAPAPSPAAPPSPTTTGAGDGDVDLSDDDLDDAAEAVDAVSLLARELDARPIGDIDGA